MSKHTTPTVDAIARIPISGNVIPPEWFHHITRAGGKPDLNAIVILSEIIYWYRPTVDRDEHTMEVKSVRNKFKGHKLQVRYAVLMKKFGLSRTQAADAVKRLIDLGLITQELRTEELPDGRLLSNVMYLEPIPEEVERITLQPASKSPKASKAARPNRAPSPEITIDPPQKFTSTLPRNFGVPSPEISGYPPQKFTDIIENKDNEINREITHPQRGRDDRFTFEIPFEKSSAAKNFTQIPVGFWEDQNKDQYIGKRVDSHDIRGLEILFGQQFGEREYTCLTGLPQAAREALEDKLLTFAVYAGERRYFSHTLRSFIAAGKHLSTPIDRRPKAGTSQIAKMQENRQATDSLMQAQLFKILNAEAPNGTA